MPMFTARVSDSEMRRLRALAEREGVPMAELLRRWLTAAEHGSPAPASGPEAVEGPEEIAPAEPLLDAAAEAGATIVGGQAYGRPPFLAAPEDSCATCGHDWHGNETGCTFQVGTSRRRPVLCVCRAYQSAPLF